MHRRLSVLADRRSACELRRVRSRARDRTPQRRQEFRDYVTINVSEFFRDGDRFGDLERSVLPGCLARRSALRAWSAGCSIGAEPYSLAMLLLRDGARSRRTRSWPPTSTRRSWLAPGRLGLPAVRHPQRRRRAHRALVHRRRRTASYTLKPAPRALVTFRKHDLLRDRTPSGPFDLICCRNVVIYFTEEAKERIYAGFVGALRPGRRAVHRRYRSHHATEAAWELHVVGPGFYQKVEQVMARAA